MPTSSHQFTFSLTRAVASGLIIAVALVASIAWGAYIPAPGSAGPAGNASTPIYTDATQQATTNLGIKRDTTALYDFAVKGASRVTKTFISQQNVVFDGNVLQKEINNTPKTLDIQGNLYAVGSVPSSVNTSNSNIRDMALARQFLQSNTYNGTTYSPTMTTSFTNSDPVCATQGGVLVRCTGCTDATATNYDPAALTDDGSCNVPPVPGCMDATASNYDPNATADDGSCVYPPTPTGAVYYHPSQAQPDYSDPDVQLFVDYAEANGLDFMDLIPYTQDHSVTTGSCPGCTDTQFTVPQGVTSITIQAWGAGGGGGASDVRNITPQTQRGLGASGGSGSYISQTISVVPGEIFDIALGAGGRAGMNACASMSNMDLDMDTNNDGTVQLAELVGNPQYLDISCTSYAAHAGHAGGSTLVTRSSTGHKLTAPGGGGGGSSSSCVGGLLGTGSSAPHSTIVGTTNSSISGLQGNTGRNCNYVSNDFTFTGSNLGTSCGGSNIVEVFNFAGLIGGSRAICAGGSSGDRIASIGQEGSSGGVKITW
ncbi:hypothetical protein H6776_00660 [Candidatus Nomurabacteria bacterium]|nr:hypothetical protein [Candidatus Nomurabacteria bacterium]